MMRRFLRGAELGAWFVALCIAGVLYEVFVAPDQRARAPGPSTSVDG